MADKDFVVKNGLVVNTSILVANGTKVGVNTASPDAALTVAGTANLQGNVSFTGNEIITTANSTFFGNVHVKNNVYIDKKLYVGNTQTMVQDLPTIIQAVDNFNGFVMVSSQNLSKEDDACADLLIYADDTNGLSNFNDIGINNSRFDGRIQRIIVNSVANSWSLGQTVYQKNGAGANIAVGELRDIVSINSTAVSLKIKVSEDDGLPTYVGMADFSNTTGSNLSLYAVTNNANASIIAAVPFFSPQANTLTRRNYAFTIGKRGDGYLYNANSALTIGTTSGGIRSQTETISTGFSSGVNTIVLSSGNTNNIKQDMNLSGTGIDTGTYITSVINSTAFRISKPTTTLSSGSITARDEFYDINDINNPIIFHTGGMMAKNEISRFTGNGNFVIGPFTTSREAKLTVNGTANIVGQTNVGANVNVVGNINASANVMAPVGMFATSVNVGATSTNSTTFVVGNATVNATAINMAGNSTVSTTTLRSSNLTIGNTSVTDASAFVRIQNSTISSNLTAVGLAVGISTVNSTVMSVGANVVTNASTISVGNTTVKAVLSQNATAALQVTGNATVSANLTTANLIITNTVLGQANFAGNVAISGNTNVTGNVYAPSGVFSTSANVGSVAISTTDVNVGANVKVDVAGLKIAGNSSVASVNVAAALVALGNSTVTGTSTVQVSNSSFTSNVIPGSFVAGISTVNTTTMSVGANVVTNASTISVGNTTVKAVLSQNTTAALQVTGNATISANLTTGNLIVTSAVRGDTTFANSLNVTGNTNVTGNVYAPSGVFSTSANVGSVSISTSEINVGSNVKVDVAGFKVTGNSTLASINVSSGDVILGNSTVVDAPYVQVQNSTASANLTSTGLTTGISAVNTTAISVGANVIANASTVSVGNATIGVVASQNATLALQVSGNASVSGNLTTGNLTVTSAVRGNLSLANNLSVTGNTNVTGNVYAPSGVFSTSANIGAVAISTSAITVGSNVTVDAAGFKVVGNSTIASMNIVSGNVIVGNSSIAAAPTVQVINSTSSANVSPGLFSAGISGVNTTAVYVGANVIANASAVTVGNATVNVVLTQNATAALQVTGNATVSANLTTGNLIITSAVRGQANFAGNVAIAGNTNVTGNVYAPSGVFSTSANIGAVAISTSAMTVGSNVTVDAAGLRVTGNSTIASMNVLSGNIVIGNNSITATPIVQISNATASANLSPAGVNAGILGVFGNSTAAVINVGSNVVINTSVIAIGNSSVNVVVNPSDPSYQLNLQGNAYVNGDVIITKNLTVSGTTTYSGTTLAAGNFIPSTNATFDIGNSSIYWKTAYARDVVVPNNGIVSIGNSTVNAVINSSSAIIGNSTVNAVINSTSLLVGNVVSTSVNASANVRVGANVLMNATTLAAANGTAITIHDAGGIIAGNTTITSAPRILVQNTAGTTTINSNFISTTSISGNLTGNVVAGTISGNLTGNVVATTISGNLTGNVVSTVVSTTNATVSGTITASNTAANSTTAAALWLSGATGSMSIDSNMAKRLSWNDIAGSSLSLRAGHYSNGTVNLFRSDGSGSGGAAAITFTTDGATTNGIITQSVAAANGDGNSVVWVTNTTLNTTALGIGANLAVTGNASISGFAAISGNATIGGNVTITGNLIVLGTTTTQNSASLNVTDLVITVAQGAASPAAADGAGLKVDTANATLLYKNASNTWLSNVNFTVGNSTSNVFANSTAFVGNTNGVHTGNVVGNISAVTISSSANIAVGANVLITTANIAIGNSTAKVYANSTAFVGNVAATTITGNLTGNVVATNISATSISGNLTGNVVATTISGNLTGNVVATTISSATSVTVGANVLVNTSTLAIGNSTTNVFVNSTAFVGNVVATRVTGNLVGNVAATTITGNLTGNVVATTISGNLTGNVIATSISGNLTGNVTATNITGNLTGNVAAITITGNLTGNVAATTITGNLTGNVAAVTISGNLTGNVVATTISSSANITVGANVLITTANLAIGNSTANVFVNSTAFVGNVVATRVTGNLTGNVTATTITGNLTGNVVATTISGNLTGNVAATTISGNLTGNVVSTTLSASSNIAVGANVLITTANLAIGNTTANVYANSTAFVGNVVAARVTGNLVGNVTATTITGNLTGNVVATTISGNLTGNVAATTISGNLTGNVAATTITGNLTGNVIATTISGNLTGNVVATTISGNLAGNVSSTTTAASANVTVGANVFMNTSTLSISNTTAVSIHDARSVILGNSSIVSAPQIVVQNTAGTTTVNSTAISTSNLVLSGTLLGATINATTVNSTSLQSTSMNVSTANAVSYSLNGTEIANSTGVYATYFNGQQASFYLNAGNFTGTLPYTTIPANVINTTADFTRTGVTTLQANLVLGNSSIAVGLQANDSYGTAGQVLVSNGTATYWSDVNAAAGIISSIVAGAGLTGGGTSGAITLDIGAANGIFVDVDAISVVAGTGTIVNTSGIHVNATYIATLDSNNTTFVNGKTESNLNVNNALTVTNITRSYAATADLNTLTTSGFYRSDVASNSPSEYGNMIVSQGADTIGQIYVNFYSGTLYSRGAYGIGGSPVWSTWKTILDNGNFNTYSPTLTGGGASGNWGINISGTAALASNLTSNRNNWGSTGVISAVVGQLAWKNYGSGHTIFDASAGTSPDGGSIDRSNPSVGWTASYPTLMGWNGAQTFGVRVDQARYADSAGSAASYTYLGARVTTDGGTTQTFNIPGGNLNAYMKIFIRAINVSHSGTGTTVRQFLLNGQGCSDTYAGSGLWVGWIEVDLATGTGIFADAGASSTQLVSKQYNVYNGSSSLSFTTSGGNGFDGGTLYFYGVR